MELQCPNCGASVPAENINIQELVAVCGECNHVFEVTRRSIARKAQLRKLKPPHRVTTYAVDDSLELSYRLALGSGPKFGVIMATLAAVVTATLLIAAAINREPVSLLFLMSLLVAVYSYVAVANLTMTTTVRAGREVLEVSSGPLPFPLKDDKTLNIPEIVRVFSEETYEPFPPFRAHNVRAELRDGEKISVVTALPRPHARYIAQVLDDYLHGESDVGSMESGGNRLDEVAQQAASEAAEDRHQRESNA